MEGSQNVRVVLEGSGFMMTSLVRVNGVSVKTIFGDLRRLEFDMPASAVERATPKPLFRARARAERHADRVPRRFGACLQPASGGRDLEHGSPIGAAKVSVPAPLPGPERRDPATSIPSIAARCEPSRYSTAP